MIEGFLAAKGAVLAVADADGQHDFQLLPELLAAVEAGAGVAVASRYVPGGSVGAWDERRYALSRLATRLAQRLCRVPVSDPMSGYFAVSRLTFQEALPRLNPVGFKILLDLLAHLPPDTVVREIPLRFGGRLHGESKLSRLVQLQFLEYVYDVTLGRWMPLVFVKYCVVGALGVLVNAAAFWVASALLGPAAQETLFGFSVAVLVAIETAIVFNFLLNNAWTFSLSPPGRAARRHRVPPLQRRLRPRRPGELCRERVPLLRRMVSGRGGGRRRAGRGGLELHDEPRRHLEAVTARCCAPTGPA